VAFPIYQTSNVLFIAVPTACMLAAALERVRGRKLVAVAALAVCVMLGFFTQEFPLSPRGDGGLIRLEDAAEAVRQLSRESDVLFTLSTELAVETKRTLLPGWNLSEFSYFPDGSETQLRPLGFTTRAMLRKDLAEARPAIIALTRRHMGMLGADVMNTAREHYRFAASVERYGQFYEPLYLFVRR
jgi:hypothetical protein